ncbi:hypothetical protein BCD67_21295 [Oscillatoriales cyanobacterium USR001]|nr:hypothetical protein BCD67_21295 [Oscillatoriales cyanobacterium USR001]
MDNISESKLHLPKDGDREMVTALVPNPQVIDPLELPTSGKSSESNVSSMAVNWAKKYYTTVTAHEKRSQLQAPQSQQLPEFEGNRARTVDKLTETLKIASEIAWGKVQNLLGQDIERHAIDPELVKGSQITADARKLYAKAINAYAEEETPSRLSVLIGRDIIELRSKYSQADPLVLGFVTMEFHYLGTFLLESLSYAEQLQFLPYLKTIDDYLDIPFGEIQTAAANHDRNSKALIAVQHLLQNTTQIASVVYDRVIAQHQGYSSSNGYLTDTMVKLSSIRDVEIFQSYLCLCALEGGIRPVQQELFPLCVMLYPRLHVSWKLVQDMLLVLFWEIHDRLSPEDVMVFLPYLRTLTEMFSADVFQN